MAEEVEMRARELLAAQYETDWEICGDIVAKRIRLGNDIADVPAPLAIRAIIAALTPSPDRQAWQPIETAPTDWSVDIDLWVVSQYGAERITNCRARLSNGKPDWHMRSDEAGWVRIVGSPTHWQPLPEPPSLIGKAPQ